MMPSRAFIRYLSKQVRLNADGDVILLNGNVCNMNFERTDLIMGKQDMQSKREAAGVKMMSVSLLYLLCESHLVLQIGNYALPSGVRLT